MKKFFGSYVKNGQSNDAAKLGLLGKILVMPLVPLLTSTFNKSNGGPGEYACRTPLL